MIFLHLYNINLDKSTNTVVFLLCCLIIYYNLFIMLQENSIIVFNKMEIFHNLQMSVMYGHGLP